jgi:hypothetical protein
VEVGEEIPEDTYAQVAERMVRAGVRLEVDGPPSTAFPDGPRP